MATKELLQETPIDTPERSAELIESPQDAVIDNVTALQQETVETVEHAGAALLAGVGKVQQEIAQFVTQRIREDLETQQQLMRCRSFDDIRDVQARFIKTAMDQYSAETERLLKLGTEMMTRSVERTPD
jgi:hypothetical protein